MGRLPGGSVIMLAIAATVLAVVSGCSTDNTTSPPPQPAPTTSAIATSPNSASAQPSCPPTESQALELAANYNGGGLPSDVSINTAAMTCDSGWAEGALQSPSVGGAVVIYRVVNGAWQAYALGTQICANQQDVQRMSIAPASIRHLVNC